MLIKLPEWLQADRNLSNPHQGTVVDNSDPKKHGRIKATVPGILEGSSSSLPWIYPLNPYFLGGSSDAGLFSVPEVGSLIVVEFCFGDPHLPFYSGGWHHDLSHDATFDDSYPEAYGFHDSKGNYFKVNKQTGEILLVHSSGTKIQISQDGKITVEGKADLNVNIIGNASITAQGNVDVTTGGNAAVTATGTANVKSTGEATVESLIKANVKAPLVDLGMLGVAGVVHELSYCPIMGNHAGSGSKTVKAAP